MTTDRLRRRVSSLETIAEQCHRQEMRDLILSLPEASDLTPAELEDATDEAIRCLEEIRCTRA